MPEAPDPAQLAASVRRAVDDAERDLDAMPFFVRPMVRLGFTRRTGLDFDGWRRLLGDVRPTDGPERLRAELKPRLVALLEHFRTAPERARRGMGSDLRAIAEVTNRSKLRAETVVALLAWLDG